MHYDLHNADELCGAPALKGVLQNKKSKVKSIGQLSQRHKRMTGSRFSDVVYDRELSLYPGEDGYIVGRSFVIRQGDSSKDYRCATIYMSNLESQRPGAVPCERVEYADCLEGAVDTLTKCVYKPCAGYRQFWGVVGKTTTMCRQVTQVYPMLTGEKKMEGLVDCVHGQHTLLEPIGVTLEI